MNGKTAKKLRRELRRQVEAIPQAKITPHVRWWARPWALRLWVSPVAAVLQAAVRRGRCVALARSWNAFVQSTVNRAIRFEVVR